MANRIKLKDFMALMATHNVNDDTWITFGTTDGNTGENYSITLSEEDPVLFGRESVGYANTLYLEFDIPDSYVLNRNASNNITMVGDLHDAINEVLDNYGLSN